MIFTVPFTWTVVIMNGPHVGAFILGRLMHLSALMTINILSPTAYCCGRQDLFSLLLEATHNF